MDCDARKYAWRLSGVDASRHAFAAEGGYIATCDQWVPVPLGEAAGECFGPYEVLLSLCGVAMPVAMVMPAVDGAPCGRCAQQVQVLTRPEQPRHDQLDAAVLA